MFLFILWLRTFNCVLHKIGRKCCVVVGAYLPCYWAESYRPIVVRKRFHIKMNGFRLGSFSFFFLSWACSVFMSSNNVWRSFTPLRHNVEFIRRHQKLHKVQSTQIRCIVCRTRMAGNLISLLFIWPEPCNRESNWKWWKTSPLILLSKFHSFGTAGWFAACDKWKSVCRSIFFLLTWTKGVVNRIYLIHNV